MLHWRQKKESEGGSYLKQNGAMQLTPAATTYSIFGDESVSCNYDRFYGHVPQREHVLRIFKHGTLA